MNPQHHKRARLAGLGSALLVAFGTAVPSILTAGTAAAAPRPAADHVMMLTLDGFDLDYLDDVPMPNLQRLLHRGSVSQSTGVMETITNPSWSSVMTGAWPQTHRNTSYWYDPVTNTARGSQRDLAVPTIAQALREQGGTVSSAQMFTVQNYGTTYGDPEGIYTQPGGDCARRVDDTIAILEGRPVNSGGKQVTAPRIPDLMLTYCDTLDAIGHEGGDVDTRIPAALQMIDQQLGRLVQAAKDAGIYGRTTFVITGDHGMTTFYQGAAPELLAAISGAGYQAEILANGQSPKPETDAVIVVGGLGDLTLVGEAAKDPTALSRIRDAVERLPQVSAVYDKQAQKQMHMSPLHGDLLIEPTPGWSLGNKRTTPAGRHGRHRSYASRSSWPVPGSVRGSSRPNPATSTSPPPSPRCSGSSRRLAPRAAC